jgi:hypothetical protein
MKLNYITFVLFGAMLFSCGGNTIVKEKLQQEVKDPYEKLKSFHWFIGSWQNESKTGILTETWTVLNDSVFSGTSYLIEKGDTQFSEQMSIKQRGNDIFYIPVVKDQNNGKPTLFKLNNLPNVQPEDKVARFENPLHDFPQIVLYQLKGDSMLAEIAGKLDGQSHVEKFPMVKVKPKDFILNGGSPDK